MCRNETGYSNADVMLKVTDICSTNPQDPTYCATPVDLKIDRIEADLLFHLDNRTTEENTALKNGTGYPKPVWWVFTKCWDDVTAFFSLSPIINFFPDVDSQGLVQPAYKTTKNWFANPPLPNNYNWNNYAIVSQANANKASYPAADLPSYKLGAYKTGGERTAAIFNYTKAWKAGDKDPIWCPVA